MRHCTIHVAKTKELNSCALLIWAFVFAKAKSGFSRYADHIQVQQYTSKSLAASFESISFSES